MIEPKSQVKKCSAHAEILQQNDERTVYRLRETDGEVRITAYPVFPGIELAYHDVHAPSYRLAEPNAAGLIEIQHCREGRAEYCCSGEHYFLAPGDLSVVRRAAIEGEVEFPTGHYHTTKRSEVYNNLYRKMQKKDRLAAGYTLEKYERIYRQAFYDAAKKADPNWKIGKPIKDGALDSVTRETAESGKSPAQATLDTKI